MEAARWFLDGTSRGKMDAELNTTHWDFSDEKAVIKSKERVHLKETWNRGQVGLITWVVWS